MATKNSTPGKPAPWIGRYCTAAGAQEPAPKIPSRTTARDPRLPGTHRMPGYPNGDRTTPTNKPGGKFLRQAGGE